MMTKKHFEAIARTLNEFNTNGEQAEVVKQIARKLGLEFSEFNPSFDYDRFMRAVVWPPHSRHN